MARPFCVLNGLAEINASSLERMAGTTRLELATSAVTETAGTAKVRRRSKTSHFVGWVVGWKIVSLASEVLPKIRTTQ